MFISNNHNNKITQKSTDSVNPKSKAFWNVLFSSQAKIQSPLNLKPFETCCFRVKEKISTANYVPKGDCLFHFTLILFCLFFTLCTVFLLDDGFFGSLSAGSRRVGSYERWSSGAAGVRGCSRHDGRHQGGRAHLPIRLYARARTAKNGEFLLSF